MRTTAMDALLDARDCLIQARAYIRRRGLTGPAKVAICDRINDTLGRTEPGLLNDSPASCSPTEQHEGPVNDGAR